MLCLHRGAQQLCVRMATELATAYPSQFSMQLSSPVTKIGFVSELSCFQLTSHRPDMIEVENIEDDTGMVWSSVLAKRVVIAVPPILW